MEERDKKLKKIQRERLRKALDDFKKFYRDIFGEDLSPVFLRDEIAEEVVRRQSVARGDFLSMPIEDLLELQRIVAEPTPPPSGVKVDLVVYDEFSSVEAGVAMPKQRGRKKK